MSVSTDAELDEQHREVIAKYGEISKSLRAASDDDREAYLTKLAPEQRDALTSFMAWEDGMNDGLFSTHNEEDTGSEEGYSDEEYTQEPASTIDEEVYEHEGNRNHQVHTGSGWRIKVLCQRSIKMQQEPRWNAKLTGGLLYPNQLVRANQRIIVENDGEYKNQHYIHVPANEHRPAGWAVAVNRRTGERLMMMHEAHPSAEAYHDKFVHKHHGDYTHREFHEVDPTLSLDDEELRAKLVEVVQQVKDSESRVRPLREQVKEMQMLLDNMKAERQAELDAEEAARVAAQEAEEAAKAAAEEAERQAAAAAAAEAQEVAEVASAAEAAAEVEEPTEEPAVDGEEPISEPVADGQEPAAQSATDAAADGEAPATELVADGEEPPAEPAVDAAADGEEPAADGEELAAQSATDAAAGEEPATEPIADGEEPPTEVASESQSEAEEEEPDEAYSEERMTETEIQYRQTAEQLLTMPDMERNAYLDLLDYDQRRALELFIEELQEIEEDAAAEEAEYKAEREEKEEKDAADEASEAEYQELLKAYKEVSEKYQQLSPDAQQQYLSQLSPEQHQAFTTFLEDEKLHNERVARQLAEAEAEARKVLCAVGSDKLPTVKLDENCVLEQGPFMYRVVCAKFLRVKKEPRFHAPSIMKSMGGAKKRSIADYVLHGEVVKVHERVTVPGQREDGGDQTYIRLGETLEHPFGGWIAVSHSRTGEALTEEVALDTEQTEEWTEDINDRDPGAFLDRKGKRTLLTKLGEQIAALEEEEASCYMLLTDLKAEMDQLVLEAKQRKAEAEQREAREQAASEDAAGDGATAKEGDAGAEQNPEMDACVVS